MTTYRYLCLAVLIVAVCVHQIKAGAAKKTKTQIMKHNAKEIERKNHDPESPWEDLIARMIYMTNGEKKKPKTNKRRLKKKVIAESLDGVPPEEPPFDEMQWRFDDEEGTMNKKRYVRRQKRSFTTDIHAYWPQKIVPYEIHASMLSTTVSSLMSAMQIYHDNTCIKWQNYTTTLGNQLGHNNYVLFLDISTGCWSHVGRTVRYSPQKLGLQQPGCTSNDTIVHEMGHAIGMHHTQKRQDRDDYVTIEWENITSGMESNFYKEITTDRAPYDYGSVLHYSVEAFGNGQRTINFLDSNLEYLPYLTLNDLSFYDKLEITLAYNCTSHCVSLPACQFGGFVNSNCKCECPDGLLGATCTQLDGNCGEIIVLQSGQEHIITSPNYGNGTYPKGEECVWLIQVPANMLVSMTVDDFNVSEAEENKCYHWLEPRYNLVGQPGPLLCGNSWELGTLTTTLNGEQNLMMLRFNSAVASDKDPSTGFSLRVKARNVVPVCESDSCKNGGICFDKPDGLNFTCACKGGFAGDVCDIIGTKTLSCTYESGTSCFLENVVGDQFNWTVQSGRTPSAHTGPSVANSGQFYNFIETSSPREYGDVARLVSSSYSFTEISRCLEIHYHMNGYGIRSLNVFTEGMAHAKTEIWSQYGHVGDVWKTERITINPIPDLKISVEGTRGMDSEGDIAIDDLVLTPNACA